MEGMISLRDALRVMACKDAHGNFIPFNLTVIQLDVRKGTGGQRVSYENAVLAGAPFGKKNAEKDANHFMNGTRNIMVPGRSRPMTIHNILISRLNGERVFAG